MWRGPVLRQDRFILFEDRFVLFLKYCEIARRSVYKLKINAIMNIMNIDKKLSI
jgi:hypothetical protein